MTAAEKRAQRQRVVDGAVELLMIAEAEKSMDAEQRAEFIIGHLRDFPEHSERIVTAVIVAAETKAHNKAIEIVAEWIEAQEGWRNPSRSRTGMARQMRKALKRGQS